MDAHVTSRTGRLKEVAAHHEPARRHSSTRAFTTDTSLNLYIIFRRRERPQLQGVYESRAVNRATDDHSQHGFDQRLSRLQARHYL
jgi:hypothetical protein